MAEFPAIPLFTDAYLADTRHLSTIQHGAYLLMLMTAWRSPGCKLKNDDKFLARITGIEPRSWHHHKDTLLAFWRLDDEGYLVQLRLLDERKYVEAKRNQQSSAGKASALKRLNRGSTSVEIRCNENSTPTPTPTPIEESKTPLSPPVGGAGEQGKDLGNGHRKGRRGGYSIRDSFGQAVAYIEARDSTTKASGQNGSGESLPDNPELLPGLRQGPA